MDEKNNGIPKKKAVVSDEHKSSLTDTSGDETAETIITRNKGTFLFVEGNTDKTLYSKFIPPQSRIEIKQITADYYNKPKQNLPKDIVIDFNHYRAIDPRDDLSPIPSPDGITVDAKKAINYLIITHCNDNKKIFIGIVDKDYDENNNCINDLLTEYENNTSQNAPTKEEVENRLQHTDETNDVEMLIVKRNPEVFDNMIIHGIHLNLLLEKAKLNTNILGFYRYADRTKLNNLRRHRLSFKTVFKTDKYPFLNYLKSIDEPKTIVNQNYPIDNDSNDSQGFWETTFNKFYNSNKTDEYRDIWRNARGHDFTAFLATLAFIEENKSNVYDTAYDKNKCIKDFKYQIETNMVEYSNPEKFIDTTVFKFIEKFSSMPKISDIMAVYAFFLTMNTYKNNGQNVEEFIKDNLECFSKLTGQDLVYLQQKNFSNDIFTKILELSKSNELKEFLEEWMDGKWDYYKYDPLNRIYVSATENTLIFAGLVTEQSVEEIEYIIDIFDEYENLFNIYSNNKFNEQLEKSIYKDSFNAHQSERNEDYWYLEIESKPKKINCR